MVKYSWDVFSDFTCVSMFPLFLQLKLFILQCLLLGCTKTGMETYTCTGTGDEKSRNFKIWVRLGNDKFFNIFYYLK